MVEWFKAHAWKACLQLNVTRVRIPLLPRITLIGDTMATELLPLDEAYANPKSDGSLFRAVKMMSEEARFINEQANLGFIELTKKPTTIAVSKFKEHRLEIAKDEPKSTADQEEDWED